MLTLPDWTRYLPDVLIGAFCLGIAWVLYHLFVTGPRQRREVLDGLAASGYAPVPIHDPRLVAAIEQQAPHRIHEILERGEAPHVRCLQAVERTVDGRTRYVMATRRAYRFRRAQGGRVNCYETMVVETMPTGVAAPFHVNAFAPGQTATAQERIENGLGQPFAGQFFAYADDPGAEVPAALQAAFSDVAPAFQGGIRPTATLPRQPLNTRFTASGWALCCDVLMDREQMGELLKVADRLSDGVALRS